MSRLLLLLAIAAIAYTLYKKMKAQAEARKDIQPKADTNTDHTMRKCKKCGVHLPEQEAVNYQTLYFCSEEHKKQYLESQAKSKPDE